ncbi:hypothetical protein SPAN111604_10570 [Sphingomonas antarctica]|uniref:hypothetical protein n=1 Tax=Sphingomonas antarctica TaxID=2040274 RepID=UPI0039EBC069
MVIPILDFTGALDKTIDDLHDAGGRAVALSMSVRRRQQLEAVVASRDITAPAGRYRGLAIREAFAEQNTVAVIDALGRAHLI